MIFYKRTEYFRFTFGEPLAAEFRIVIASDTDQESSPGNCHLIDISPGGAKFFTEYDIPLEREPVRLRTKFVLHETLLEVHGVIIWKNAFKHGYLYGYEFDEDISMEQLIVEELKLRRRSEIDLGSDEKKD